MHTHDVCSVRILGNTVGGEEALGFSRAHSRVVALMHEHISLLFLLPRRFELESWMSEFCFASRSGSEFRHIGHYFYVNDLGIARLT